VSVSPRTPIELLLAKHLPYELDMLEHTLARLLILKNNNDVLLRNALIESFWTHVRNLAEFFNQPKGDGVTGIASAQDMTKNDYPRNPELEDFDELINQQITHLRYDRPAFTDDQLDFNEMFLVRGRIERQVEKFQNNIDGKYQKFWKTRPVRKDIDEQVWISVVDAQPMATNVFDVIGPANVTPDPNRR